MFIAKTDTWTLGVAWLDKQSYGEGGLQIHIGKRILCFWTKVEAVCPLCLNEGDGWPLTYDLWNCPVCKRKYSE